MRADEAGAAVARFAETVAEIGNGSEDAPADAEPESCYGSAGVSPRQPVSRYGWVTQPARRYPAARYGFQPAGRSEAAAQRREYRDSFARIYRCWRCDAEYVVHGTQLFCSRECAREVRNERRRAANALLSRACGHCGETFRPARVDARFCSTRCRVAAHRARTAPLE
jgi:hypothetical protein